MCLDIIKHILVHSVTYVFTYHNVSTKYCMQCATNIFICYYFFENQYLQQFMALKAGDRFYIKTLSCLYMDSHNKIETMSSLKIAILILLRRLCWIYSANRALYIICFTYNTASNATGKLAIVASYISDGNRKHCVNSSIHRTLEHCYILPVVTKKP